MQADATLERLMRWYADQCDGEWEHAEGVTIETLDNPGWTVRIETKLASAPLADFDLRRSEPDTETDWLLHWVENGTFHARGDPSKLEAMLRLFLGLAERGPH